MGDRIRTRRDTLLVAALAASLVACPPRSPGRVAPPELARGPGSLVAASAASAVLLSWEPVAGATSYWVYRSSSAGAREGWEDLRAVPAVGSPPSYVWGDLENWRTYYFAVTASKDGDETLASPEAAATPRDGGIACLTLAPDAETDATVTLGGVLAGNLASTQVWFEFVTTARSNLGNEGELATAAAWYVESWLGGGYRVRADVPSSGSPDVGYQLRAQGAVASCAGGGIVAAVPRTPEVVAAGLSLPSALALGAERVFVAERDAERVVVVAKAGGACEPLAAAPAPTGLAGGDAALYALGTGGLVAIDPASLATASVAAANLGAGPSRLVLVETELFWRSDDGIREVPAAGGAPSSLTGSAPRAFATDGEALYWSEPSAVFGLPLVPGAEPARLASCAYCGGLVLAGGWAFYADAGSIFRVPAAGGARELLASSPGAWPGVADATDLFWIDGGAVLRKMPLGGGPVTALAYAHAPGAAERSLAVDATHVYWLAASDADPSTGAVFRTPKD